MTVTNLQDAISELIAKAQADRSVLHVAHDAVRLAKEYGGDSREIAVLITNAGLSARLNMEMDMPKSGVRAVLNHPPGVYRAVGLAIHLTPLAEPPEKFTDGGPALRVSRVPALLAHDPVGRLYRVDAVR